MEICINGELLDFELENEKSIGEVYNNLYEWLQESKLYPLKLIINDKEQDISSPSHWSHYPIDNETKIDLQIGTINQLYQQKLLIVIEYIELVQDAIENNCVEDFTNVYAEYGNIRVVLPDILVLNEKQFAEDFVLLDDIVKKINEEPINEKNLIKFKDILGKLRLILLERVTEIGLTDQELKRSAYMLKNMLPMLTEASILLQTGKVLEAYNTIFRTSEAISKSVRIINILHTEYPQNKIIKDLRLHVNNITTIINTMIDAVNNQDNVILADILEYNLLDQLTLFTESLLDFKMET